MSQYFANTQSQIVENQRTSNINKTKQIIKLRRYTNKKTKQNTLKRITSSLKNIHIENDKKFRYVDEEVIYFFKTDINQYLDSETFVGDLRKKINMMMKEPLLTTSILFDEHEQLIFEQTDIKSCESEANNFLRRLQKIKDRISQQKMVVLRDQNFKSYMFQAGNIAKRLNLSFLQSQYFIQANQFLKKFQKSLNYLNKASTKPYTQQLIVLTKCYNYNKSKVLGEFNKIVKKVQTLQNIQNNGYNTNQLYRKCLIKKSFIKAFTQKNCFDFFNFFKRKNHQERNSYDQYIPITSTHQYETYIKKLKNKKIFNKPAFPTNCSACLSDHSEKINPIICCSQCKYRVHKSCMSPSQNCDRCRYKKIGIQTRQKVKECFICQQKGFMLKKIQSNKYAHIFCMLAHNLWQIKGEEFIFIEDQMTEKSQDSTSFSIEKELQVLTDGLIRNEKNSEQHQMQLQNQNIQKTSQTCKFCKISTQYTVKCKVCNQRMHVICGYLNGCHFQQNWNKFTVELIPLCCQQITMRQKRQTQRKYMLNYNKFVHEFQPFPKESKPQQQIQAQPLQQFLRQSQLVNQN